MSKPELTVALVSGPDSDMDTQAIRSALEYFGARVITYWIGRPQDLIEVLSGKDIYPGTEMIVLNFHGDEGKLLMPELGEEVYEKDEPRGDFGPDEIRRFANIQGWTILANGCSLGDSALAEAFLEKGCQTYIGPDDYPYGNAALMFAIRLFYEMIQHKRSVQEAYSIAKEMDEEMAMYRIYQRS
ncbi:delta-aminolevulinic acid dehydratase [Paenibacillus tuaregi]|uniref:delta-aminolevulinic acid dehydratase n=1 Tax=Paenibacillus tuaregi TaxID=1816681 RepID=UPI0008389CFF|nr:delta-aminolevulinic acid dehydratase [Paenibacillus tuaregi]